MYSQQKNTQKYQKNIHQMKHKYAFPIEEYVIISRNIMIKEKLKYLNSKLQKTISMKKNLKQDQMLLAMKMK